MKIFVDGELMHLQNEVLLDKIELVRFDGVIETYDRRDIRRIDVINETEEYLDLLYTAMSHHVQRQKIYVMSTSGVAAMYREVRLRFLNPFDPAMNPHVDSAQLYEILQGEN